MTVVGVVHSLAREGQESLSSLQLNFRALDYCPFPKGVFERKYINHSHILMNALFLLLLVVLSVLRHHDEGKEKRFHFVEMSEREGSFSLLI